MFRIKDWPSYQSYKDRNPPWIRLHKKLLDNFEFHSMSVNARALLPMLWLLASEDADPVSGLLRNGYEKIAFRLRMQKKDVMDGILECLASGFLEEIHTENQQVTDLLHNASKSVTPETETETEKIKINNAREPDELPSAKKTKPRLIPIPTGWKPHEEHLAKCRLHGFDADYLAEQFVNDRLSKGIEYADWDRAFFTWIGNAKKFGDSRIQTYGSGNKPTNPSISEAGLRVAARCS